MVSYGIVIVPVIQQR